MSKRDGTTVNKDYLGNLGRVLDREKGIYRSRERGIFVYDLETDSYSNAPTDFKPPEDKSRRQPLIVDFGDAFFLDTYIRSCGLSAAIDAIGYGNPDTLKAMLCYYILCSMSNCHARDWWEGSYARILYPNASLYSQRISEFLAAVGDEYSQREFFREYFSFLEHTGNRPDNILIDSTGLPNSIHFPLTAISNHNGEINNEVRLIYVVQQNTGLPIYFRYCPGNVIDVTTLIRCVAELKEQGVNTKFAILDAGYYSDDNVKELFASKISFVTRLKENLKVYKELVSAHLGTLESQENLVAYNGRYVYLKHADCTLGGHSAHAYIGLDISRKASESQQTFRRAKSKNLTNAQVYNTIQKQGVFILISSRRIAVDKVLPLYYTRQQIEQIFDIGKNYADMLPLRIRTIDTFRGHILLTFIATVVVKKIQDELKDTPITPMSLFMNLRNHKCKIYKGKVITQEAFKKANDCYKIFKIDCPITIPYKQSLWLEN